MKLSEYITKEYKKGRRKFDVGIRPDMEVYNKSLNRVKFEVK